MIDGGVLLGAVAVACLSTWPYVVGPNDGSRMATVECLVDQHTLVIEDSWFEPYCDKLLINGRYYSDKPPVPAILMAGEYQVLQWVFGLRLGDKDQHVLLMYLLTLGSSGAAYVAAVWCVYRTAGVLGLSTIWRIVLTVVFGQATVALVYVRHVNGHIVGLGLAAAIFLQLAELSRRTSDAIPVGRFIFIGLLGGLFYAVEQPTGGLLLLGSTAVAGWRRPGWGGKAAAVGWAALGALPWLALHHAVVYAYAGTIDMPNNHAEFFDYPGTEFSRTTLTGRWNHRDFGAFLEYAALMLFGERGFVTTDPTLWLAIPGGVLVWLKARAERPEVLLACAWPVSVWLLYGALSINYSGACCTIRWFVPLLAAAYYLLALLLRDYPLFRTDFIIFGVGGAALAWFFWCGGPWYEFPPQKQLDGVAAPLFWTVQGAFAAALVGRWIWWFAGRAPRSAASE
jgi:hypothetical protein